VVKTYRLSRKTILNIVGVVKMVAGKRVWITWELDLGKPPKKSQRYYTLAESKRIIEAAEGQYRVLFALLAATGMRIGEGIGIYIEDIDLEHAVIGVRRAVWNGKELTPKTENGVREIDIDAALVTMLKEFIGDRKEGLLFQTSNGTPLDPGNVRRRVLAPLLKKLGISHGATHAFRHGRVTMLRKFGTPADLQKQWIGHSSLRTGDRYSHTHEEVEYRKSVAAGVGLGVILDPMDPTQARTRNEN
jgi:integrase